VGSLFRLVSHRAEEVQSELPKVQRVPANNGNRLPEPPRQTAHEGQRLHPEGVNIEQVQPFSKQALSRAT